MVKVFCCSGLEVFFFFPLQVWSPGEAHVPRAGEGRFCGFVVWGRFWGDFCWGFMYFIWFSTGFLSFVKGFIGLSKGFLGF